MAQIVNQFETNIPKYHIVCFNCGCEVVYKQNEIHRNPGLNMVVRRHGFSGYDGEVHCPGCGTWLPHYEQNRYTEQAPEQKAPGEAPAGFSAATKFCPNCGKPASSDSKFCKFCGSQIS